MAVDDALRCAASRSAGGKAELIFAVSGVTGSRDRFELLLETDDLGTPISPVAVRARQGVSYPFVLDDRVYWRVQK